MIGVGIGGSDGGNRPCRWRGNGKEGYQKAGHREIIEKGTIADESRKGEILRKRRYFKKILLCLWDIAPFSLLHKTIGKNSHCEFHF